MREIIDKYFKEDRVLYFNSSDAHRNIEGDTYLRYSFNSNKIELWLGGNNGEICISVISEAEKLEKIIKLLIF